MHSLNILCWHWPSALFLSWACDVHACSFCTIMLIILFPICNCKCRTLSHWSFSADTGQCIYRPWILGEMEPSSLLLFEHSVNFTNWLELRIQKFFRGGGSSAMRWQLRQVTKKILYKITPFHIFFVSTCRYQSPSGTCVHSVYTARYPLAHWPFSGVQSAQRHFSANLHYWYPRATF